MTDRFHDSALDFMTDLLKLLEKQAQSTKLGESLGGKESVYSSLLRLIGVTENATLDVGNNPNSKEQQKVEPTENLLDNFFKSKTGSSEAQVKQINSLLKTYQRRLKRYSQARQQIKLNRTRRLIDDPKNPLDSQKLVKDSPEQTRIELSTKQTELREDGDLTGILDQDISLQRALEISVRDATDIPENTGVFRSQLARFIGATAQESARKIEKINILKQEIQNEVNRLENAEKSLFDGVETFSGEDQKLSLLQVLDVLIFLTNRQEARYDCSQCKFFNTGKSNVCIYAGEGSTSPASLVKITDEEGNTITGRLTRATNSCKEVWGLDGNDYYRPSDSITKSIKKFLGE